MESIWMGISPGRATTRVTTNVAFRDWPTIFPNATCVSALIDRVVHHASRRRRRLQRWNLLHERTTTEGCLRYDLLSWRFASASGLAVAVFQV
jgi:hypothetical protein